MVDTFTANDLLTTSMNILFIEDLLDLAMDMVTGIVMVMVDMDMAIAMDMVMVMDMDMAVMEDIFMEKGQSMIILNISSAEDQLKQSQGLVMAMNMAMVLDMVAMDTVIVMAIMGDSMVMDCLGVIIGRLTSI